nr:reverse transcriptase domain-containing protein [Tanacetum cinerariifolium]
MMSSIRVWSWGHTRGKTNACCSIVSRCNTPSVVGGLLGHRKKHNESPTGLLKPIQLSFDNEGGPEKEHGEELEDFRKPYKEVLKSPFSRRIIEFSAPKHRTPKNSKIYDGSTDPDGHITRFVRAANQGEWEMHDPTEVAKIVRRANETLPDFKERWTEEMSYIPDDPVVMRISAFMSNLKCPELARRFSDQVPQTVTEMMRRVDDFVKSEEVFKNTELPKGKHPERPAITQFRGSRDRGRQSGNNNGPRKVINMVRQSNNGLKCKSLYKQSEEWMDVPITFPPVSTDDVSAGPLIVEANVEGYWIRRDIKARLAPTQTELVGFSGKQLIPIGKIELKESLPYAPGQSRYMSVDGRKKGDGTRGNDKRNERDKEPEHERRRKTCPKYYYPLPEIDLKIEAFIGHPFKCFLDAYKGYHQIQMSKEDEDKTALYIDHGTYCYVKMPFGLKNAGATYQRLIDSAFQTQLGRNLEVYVDDMVIKSMTEQDTIMDIAETFDNLRKINMKLKPLKCSFGIGEGKIQGYMVTLEGIRVNPKKTKAIADMQSPKTLKEMQSLSRKLATLNRFLSRSAERSFPFFETLKNITKENKEDYKWTEVAEHAF